MSISLVAALGNPGREYEDTRHNLGWVVVDAFVRQLGLEWKKQASFEAQVARWDRLGRASCLFVKPLTFMNESGRAVGALARYHKIGPDAVAAVYDDANIDLGLVKVTTTGSAGGHNGVASLLEHLGTGFARYRLGIGPKTPPPMDLKDFVLGKFTPAQQSLIQQSLPQFLNGLSLLLTDGPERAMNLLNRRANHESEQT